MRWSPDDEKLAAGCGDGLVRIYDKDGKLQDRLGSVPVEAKNALSIGNDKLPVMSMRGGRTPPATGWRSALPVQTASLSSTI